MRTLMNFSQNKEVEARRTMGKVFIPDASHPGVRKPCSSRTPWEEERLFGRTVGCMMRRAITGFHYNKIT
jgi:hypothetical protein